MDSCHPLGLGGDTWGGAHSEVRAINVFFVGRRKKVSGRKKTQSRSSVKSRSSGTRSRKRQGRVKKRKGKKIKVASDGGVTLGELQSCV